MFSRRGTLAMKNPDPNADGGTSPEPLTSPEADDPQAQQVDLDDADVSAEPSQLPPGLPPLPLVSSPPSMAPPVPAARSRGPMFYVGILVGVLVVSAAVGTLVALSRRHAPTATATAAAPSVSAAPKVITIRTIEMDDNPDSGP
jgi:hypothetical protein